MRKQRLQWTKIDKNGTVEDWKKVLFSDESHFFVQGKHSQFVRISKGEQLSLAHFNEVVKHQTKSKKRCFGVVSVTLVSNLLYQTRV